MKLKRGTLLILVFSVVYFFSSSVDASHRHGDFWGDEEDTESESNSGGVYKRRLRTSAAEKIRRKGRLKFKDYGKQASTDSDGVVEGATISQGSGGLDSSLTGFPSTTANNNPSTATVASDTTTTTTTTTSAAPIDTASTTDAFAVGAIDQAAPSSSSSMATVSSSGGLSTLAATSMSSTLPVQITSSVSSPKDSPDGTFTDFDEITKEQEKRDKEKAYRDANPFDGLEEVPSVTSPPQLSSLVSSISSIFSSSATTPSTDASSASVPSMTTSTTDADNIRSGTSSTVLLPLTGTPMVTPAPSMSTIPMTTTNPPPSPTGTVGVSGVDTVLQSGGTTAAQAMAQTTTTTTPTISVAPPEVVNYDTNTNSNFGAAIKAEDSTSAMTNTNAQAAVIEPPPSCPDSKRCSKSSLIPTEHSYHRFLNKKINQAIRLNAGMPFDVVLLGDSVFSHVQREGKIWGPFAQKFKILNLGSPGDRTEHVLFRLENRDLLQHVGQSRIVVIMVGTNNVGIGDNSDSVVAGISAVVTKVLLEFNKDVHVVLMGLLPRMNDAHNVIIQSANTALQKRYKDSTNIHFLNLFDAFYDKKHSNPREKMYMPDHIHPSAKGYTVMVDSISPFLEGHFGTRTVLSGVLGAEAAGLIVNKDGSVTSNTPTEENTGMVDTSLAMVGLGFSTPSSNDGAVTTTNPVTGASSPQPQAQNFQIPFQTAQQQQLQAPPATPDPNVPTHYENWS